MTCLRTQKLYRGIFASFLSRGFVTVSQLFITAIVTRHLFGALLGEWMLLSQSILVITVLDFGLGGGGLRNQIVYLKTDLEKKMFFTASFWLAFWICLPITVIFLIMSIYRGNLKFYIPVALLVLRLPLTFYISGFFAFDEIQYKAIFESLEMFFLTVITFILFSIKLPISIIYIGIFSSYTLLSFFGLLSFCKIRCWKFQYITLKKSFQMIRPSLKITIQFWAMSLSSMGLFAMSPYIVGSLLGLNKAGEFCLFYRMFSIVIGAHFIIVNSLWSSFSNAHMKQDGYWIRKHFKKNVVVTVFIFSTFGAVLIFFHPLIFKFWTSQNISNRSLAVVFSFSIIFYGLVNLLSALLNAFNRVSSQLKYTAFGALLNICLGVVFGNIWQEVGVMVGFLLSLFPLLISNFIAVKKLWLNKELLA